MSVVDEIAIRLRERILTGLHSGDLEPEDPLPSIRALAAELDRDHRAVAKAYRRLEVEGLVEIRARSGVFVASRTRLADGDTLSPVASWVRKVITEGLTRRIPIPDLPTVIAQCTTSVDLRCGCVDSVTDGVDALVFEVETLFGLEAEPILVSDDAPAPDPSTLDGLDVILTSVFAASRVRELARSRDIPFVEMQVNPEWTASLRRGVDEGKPLVVVARDPAFCRRIEGLLPQGAEVRFLSVDEAEGSLTGVPEDAAVFVTPSARDELDDVEHPGLLSVPGLLAHGSAGHLAEIIVQKNVDAHQDG